MAPNLKKLLGQARKAYAKGDRKGGAKLVDQILGHDFNYVGVWELLQEEYGSGQSLEVFKRAFTTKYYPKKAYLLKVTLPDSIPQVAYPKPTTLEAKNGKPATLLETGNQPEKQSFLRSLFPQRSTPTTSAAAPVAKPAPADQKTVASPGDGQTWAVTPPVLQAPPVNQPATATLPKVAPFTGEVEVVPSGYAHTETLNPRPVRDLIGASASAGAGKIRVIVVDDIAQTRETIERTLKFHNRIDVIGTAANGADGVRLAVQTRPDVVVMDVNMPGTDGIAATQGIKSAIPSAQVIILTVQDDVDYMRNAMRVGARDFLTKPPEIDELVSAVLRAGDFAHLEKAKQEKSAASLQQIAGVSAEALAVLTPRGKVISLFSPKGGVGCSVLASNLAAVLGNEETKVAMVDAALGYGDIAILFNEVSKNSLADLAPRAHELDQEIVEEVMVKHASGVSILAAPHPQDAEQVTGEQVSELIQFLRQIYDYVVVDNSHRLDDVTIAALDASDLIILVTTQEIPSLARSRRFLELAPLLNIDTRRILAVVNQYDQRINISAEKVSQNFRLEVPAVVPLESAVVLPSVNRGQPFMLQPEMRTRPLGKSILDLTAAIRQRVTA